MDRMSACSHTSGQTIVASSPGICIPAKPLHNHELVSERFNHFYCMEICDKLSRDWAMLSYIYLNVDECCLTSSMPQQRFKLEIVLNYAVMPNNVISED